MTSSEQLADFIDRRILFPRLNVWESGVGPWRYQGDGWFASRPSAEELAHQLLADAEFQALRLGSWLESSDGQFFTRALELSTPLLYRSDIELLVVGLQLAAQLQRREGVEVAGRIATIVIGVAGLAALSLMISGRRTA